MTTSNPYAEFGVTDLTAARLDMFGAARPPQDRDVFHDSTPAGSAALTKGQVWALRASLREAMKHLLSVAHQAGCIAQATGAPLGALFDKDGFERELKLILDTEDALLSAWAEAEARDVTVPDVYPDGLL